MRRYGTRALVVALGLSLGVGPAALAANAPVHGGHGAGSSQAALFSAKRTVKFSQLPPVSQDNPLVSLPIGVTLSQAQSWLSRVILIRQTALLSLSASLATDHVILASDRAQLVALIDAAMARLNAIATGMTGDANVAAVRRQAQQVMGILVFNTLEPQIRLLSRVDVALAFAAQLSAKESSAAAAIAISRANAASVHAELTLDSTIKSLAQAITSELTAAQSALLALSGSSDADSAAFTSTKVTLSTAYSQLRVANTDLRNLVVQLVGR